MKNTNNSAQIDLEYNLNGIVIISSFFESIFTISRPVFREITSPLKEIDAKEVVQ